MLRSSRARSDACFTRSARLLRGMNIPIEKEFVLLEDPRDHLSMMKVYRGEQTAIRT